jgi:hypothetical protein
VRHHQIRRGGSVGSSRWDEVPGASARQARDDSPNERGDRHESAGATHALDGPRGQARQLGSVALTCAGLAMTMLGFLRHSGSCPTDLGPRRRRRGSTLRRHTQHPLPRRWSMTIIVSGVLDISRRTRSSCRAVSRMSGSVPTMAELLGLLIWTQDTPARRPSSRSLSGQAGPLLVLVGTSRPRWAARTQKPQKRYEDGPRTHYGLSELFRDEAADPT